MTSQKKTTFAKRNQTTVTYSKKTANFTNNPVIRYTCLANRQIMKYRYTVAVINYNAKKFFILLTIAILKSGLTDNFYFGGVCQYCFFN